MISTIFEIFVLSMVRCRLLVHLLTLCLAGCLLRGLDNQLAGAELQEKTGEREEDRLKTGVEYLVMKSEANC